MLDDKSLREEAYQSFLSNHAGFLFPTTTNSKEQVVISKLRLGSDYITDFIIACNNRSYGFRYTFVEIESPHTPPFVNGGRSSARLSAAIEQIMSWQRWLERNRSESKKLFPSKHFLVTDIPDFSYLVVIGRRRDMEPFLAERNHYSKTVNIEIRSFDYLTDLLKSGRSRSFTWISRDLPTVLDIQNNEFSNPFFCSYTDTEWRKIINEPKLNISHMVGHNLEILLRHRRYNPAEIQEFMSYLLTLSQNDRRIPTWEYEYLKMT